ncbi:MAG: LPS-assembly protein LptD [Planctomycetes bacterium]|nr:LPS-assembly protein LptD [Planctomycetota bacterium]
MHRTFILILLVAAIGAGALEVRPLESAAAEPKAPEPAEAEAAAFTSEGGKLSLKAELIEYDQDMKSFAATGNVRVTWGDTILTADHALGWPPEVYIEGNVRLLSPTREIHCERALVNWADAEVVFEEFKFRDRDKTKKGAFYVSTPLGIRLADRTLIVKEGIVSNCDYAVTHHYLRARKLIIKPNNTIIAKGVSYHVRGVPIFYLPAIIIPGDLPALDARFGSTSSLGMFGTLDATFGLPLGYDAKGTVSLGYFSKRGIGWGLGLGYDSPLLAKGKAEYYAIPDDAGNDFDGQVLGTHHRYRYKWTHSMDSPRWELDIELQKYSDAGFQKEFFENEYYTGKPIENRIYAKGSKDNWVAYVEAKLRLNEYLDQTERLPMIGMRGFAHPLRHGFLWTSTTEFGFLRRGLSEIRQRPGESDAAFNARRRKWNAFGTLPAISADEELGEDRTVFRYNAIHELSRSIPVNRFKFEPFIGMQSTFYSERLADDHSTSRLQLFYGGRLSTSLHRYFGFTSKTLGVDGLRHIILPDITYTGRRDTWGADADDFIQFDETDAVRQEDRIELRLRNKFQARRGGRIVDLLDLDLETDHYPASRRDNNGENFSPLRIDARLRPVEGLNLYSNIHYDFSEQDQGMNFANFGANIDVTDRWAAYIGHTYEKAVDNFGTYSLAYKLTPKWTAVLSHDRSWKDGQSLEERLELIRDFHAFSLSIVVENDGRSNEQSVGFMISPKAIKMPPRPGSFVRGLTHARDYDE